MLRSGWLVGLDGDAAELAAVGLVRLAMEEKPDAAATGPGGRSQARAFADAWLAFGDSWAPGLRAPAGTVLRALLCRAAELLLAVHHGEEPDVLEALGRRAAEAREEACREGTAHPAEPTACTLLWHAVRALAEDGGPEHYRRIEERCEAYVRDGHHRQDTLELVVACAGLAADALVELSGGDPGRAAGRLAEHAARYMPSAGPAAPWVPSRP
ncbi:hypothetical protein [Kitasatospora azatica]|uniref:hypothetical protein n=1 Tax=Kitasatospora azatica TaxID=58347 RepID=UPI00056AE749|nr:hypothetical protein [Kitasatospora azatica]